MKHILLIEDNQDHTELILDALQTGLGPIHIEHTTNVEEAFRLIQKSNFDLILSDYYLPDSHDETYIEKISEQAPDTPLIIITGRGDESTAARCIQAGAEDYIVKTREALQALPGILQRTLTKHESTQRKKKKAMVSQNKNQEKSIQELLKAIGDLEKSVKVVEAEGPLHKKLLEKTQQVKTLLGKKNK